MVEFAWESHLNTDLPFSDRFTSPNVFLGSLFGLGGPFVGRNINPLLPLPAGVFRIPERWKEPIGDEIGELFFDATERPTRRQPPPAAKPRTGVKEGWRSGCNVNT